MSIAANGVPRIGTPACSSRRGKAQRRLAAELDNDAQRPLPLDDLEHVLDVSGSK